jgi:hypothetical protein
MKFLPSLLGLSLTAIQAARSAPATDDPCAKIAGKTYALPRDVQACYRSFPFNETIRQNVLSVVSRVFDFYTFEDYYDKLPDPFHGSTVDIRATIDRINKTEYDVSGDFRIRDRAFLIGTLARLPLHEGCIRVHPPHERWPYPCVWPPFLPDVAVALTPFKAS